MYRLPIALTLVLACQLLGCRHDLCQKLPAQARIDVTLQGVALPPGGSVEVTLEVNGSWNKTRRFPGATSFVFEFGALNQPPRTIRIDAVARNEAGRAIGFGDLSRAFTPDGCNLFGVVVKPGSLPDARVDARDVDARDSAPSDAAVEAARDSGWPDSRYDGPMDSKPTTDTAPPTADKKLPDAKSTADLAPTPDACPLGSCFVGGVCYSSGQLLGRACLKCNSGVLELQPNCVQTVAGSSQGYVDSATDGLEAKFQNPIRMDIYADHVYLVDRDVHAVRKVYLGTSGAVSTVASGGGLSLPVGISVNPLGMYAASEGNSTIHWIAGLGPGTVKPFSSGSFSQPRDLAVDSSGNVYVADTTANAIKKIDAKTSAVTTFSSGLTSPVGLAYHAANGKLYVAEASAIREVDLATGSHQPFVGGLSTPMDLAIHNDGTDTYMYIAHRYGCNVMQVVMATKTITTLAGYTGASPAPGTACQLLDHATDRLLARFKSPDGVAATTWMGRRIILVSDSAAYRIRIIVP